MSSSGEEQIPGYDNRGTMIVSEAHLLRRTPVPLKDVWEAHWDAIYGNFDHERGSGYALVLFDDLGNPTSAPRAVPIESMSKPVSVRRSTISSEPEPGAMASIR